MTKQQEQLLENKVRKIVKDVLNEEKVPQNATFTVINGINALRRFLTVLEKSTVENADNPTKFFEDYDDAMSFIKQKIQQIETTVKRSR